MNTLASKRPSLYKIPLLLKDAFYFSEIFVNFVHLNYKINPIKKHIIMKKFFFMLIALFVVAIVVTMVAMPSVKTTPGIFISSDEGQPLADSIMKIVKVSCMDCHGDGGNGMACSHVNFSKWSTYKLDKQAAKANDICKIMTKGSMPPKRFCASNPAAVPTQAQITAICNWAKTLNK